MYNRRNVIIKVDHMGILREKEQTREEILENGTESKCSSGVREEIL